MDGCPKAVGMLMMLRSMAPDVMAVDEAGGENEIRAMKYGMNCGCRILATVHGADIGDIMKRPAWRNIAGEKIFSRYVVLSGALRPGKIAEIYDERHEMVAAADSLSGIQVCIGGIGSRLTGGMRLFWEGGGHEIFGTFCAWRQQLVAGGFLMAGEWETRVKLLNLPADGGLFKEHGSCTPMRHFRRR